MNLTQRTLKGVLWVATGTGARLFLRLAFVAVMARLLTPENFGLMTAALIVIGIGSMLTHFGIGAALVQLPRLAPAHIGSSYVLSALLGVALSLLTFLGAPLYERSIDIPGLTPVLQVLAWSFLLRALERTSARLLQRAFAFRGIAMVEILSYLIGYMGPGIVLAYLGYGVWALVVGFMAQSVFQCGALLFLNRRSFTLRTNLSAMREVVGVGVGILISGILHYGGTNVDRFVVGRFMGVADLGVYGRAIDLIERGSGAIEALISKVAFPTFADVQTNKARLARVYLRGCTLLGVITLPISVLSCLLAPEVVAIVLGSQWLAAILPLQVLSWLVFFRVGHRFSVSLLNGVGRVYWVAAFHFAYLIAACAAALSMVRFGLVGLATAAVVAQAFNFSLSAHAVCRFLGIGWKQPLLAFARGLPTAVLMGAVAFAAVSLSAGADLGPFIRFLAAVVAVAAVVLPLLYCAPKQLLGEEAIKVLQELRRMKSGRPKSGSGAEDEEAIDRPLESKRDRHTAD